uniref:Uncharacterized protein n=1 Tax=Fagus sylvatica TaxID=28930 RepID=A0A2N9HI90_FAGSY
MSKRAEKAKWGPERKKGEKATEMRAKGRAACFKVGPRAPSSRAARDDHAPVSTSAPNGPFEPPITSPHLVRSFSLWNVHLDPRRDRHANRDELRGNRKRTRKPRKSERAKIESFILCPTFLVPRNAKQRRGNCHNPIFTHRDFLGCRHARRGDPDPARMIQRSLVASNTPKGEGPGHISQAYLGGNVCAKILSDPLQLGPRAKTLRQEVHFSYHMQLSDHQELLRSSRNLSQKMTPWHKERSNGLRSQDHILRTQARLCARPVPLENRVFLTRNKLIHEARVRWKEDTLMHDVELSDRQDFIGSSRNPDRKTALKRTKNTPVASGRGTISHKSKLGFPRNPEPCKSRQRKLSDAAFARRVFPARNKLIYEPGCVGKITTPATSWNSRFAESIPRLIGIFTGKVHENSSEYPDFREP